MTLAPTFVNNRKSTNANLGQIQTINAGALGAPEPAFLLNRYRYFRAGEAITAGSWVALAITNNDLRTVLMTNSSAIILQLGAIGVATETKALGDLVKIQISGVHPDAAVATAGGSQGFWAVPSTTPGLCTAVDPATGTTLQLSNRLGILLEASAGSVASVLILPRLLI